MLQSVLDTINRCKVIIGLNKIFHYLKLRMIPCHVERGFHMIDTEADFKGVKNGEIYKN